MIKSSLDNKTYDIIVCGAGSAGVAAACSAAKAGARTLLLERHGYGGGILTAAMIHTFDAIKSCADNSVDIVAGFARELVAEIHALGGDATRDNPPEVVCVHPEMHKIAIDRLLARAGVDVLYHACVCDVLSDAGTAVTANAAANTATANNRITGVEAALRDGRARFHAPVIIDGTGDAELALHAGAPFDIAPDIQALTCHFRLGNVAPGHDWSEWETITRRALKEAHDAGEIKVYGGPWIIRLADGEISVNATRVFGNPTDPSALSRAEQEGRAHMLQIWNILRRRAPALKDSYILSGSSQLHIRESRIIRGEYVLTEEDIRACKRFDDSIAVGAWPVDIHPVTGFSGVHPHKENPFAPYEIPYRCLVPLAVDGLLVAGKPISTTHRAHGSTRVPGTSLATGQAAGVAATLCARDGTPPRALDAKKLRAALLNQNAIVSAA
ncbi:MAG: FAD-dependent oxidoreductase [Opitutaceae bacterium]|jgi:glycine/D-amino acid oxidase-like deaminating enzyme|nr:FAD-dependent oxidoreductase [Opitutaceae bacterium]